MKEKSTFGYILRLSLTLLVITGVIAAALAGVNSITKDRIAAAQEEKRAQALLEVLPDGDKAVVLDKVQTLPAGVNGVLVSDTGYAVEVTADGFGGPIFMMVGVDREGRILGVAVISHTETPSLGAVAGEKTAKGQAFRNQYIGLSGQLTVGNTVDAISGATITSKAVTEAVNAALECVRLLMQQNQAG